MSAITFRNLIKCRWRHKSEIRSWSLQKFAVIYIWATRIFFEISACILVGQPRTRPHDSLILCTSPKHNQEKHNHKGRNGHRFSRRYRARTATNQTVNDAVSMMKLPKCRLQSRPGCCWYRFRRWLSEWNTWNSRCASQCPPIVRNQIRVLWTVWSSRAAEAASRLFMRWCGTLILLTMRPAEHGAV